MTTTRYSVPRAHPLLSFLFLRLRTLGAAVCEPMTRGYSGHGFETGSTVFLCPASRVLSSVSFTVELMPSRGTRWQPSTKPCRRPTLSTASLEPTWSKAMGVVAWVAVRSKARHRGLGPVRRISDPEAVVGCWRCVCCARESAVSASGPSLVAFWLRICLGTKRKPGKRASQRALANRRRPTTGGLP